MKRVYAFEVKQFEEQQNKVIFEGYASVFDNVDMYNDIVRRGAFKKSLEGRKRPIPLLLEHEHPIGKTIAITEDAKGLKVVGEILIDIEEGRKAYRLLSEGVLTGMSIGYEPVKYHYEADKRVLDEVKLWEVSLVVFPANLEAQVEQIVAVKKVVPFQDLPLASEDRSWDGDAARHRVAKWASSDGSGDKEKIDWSKYRKAFLWYDEEAPENFTSYKFPIADVIDGRLYAVPRGIFAAAAILQGARGGTNLPDEDIEAMKRHLEKYYHKMGRSAPWEEEKNLASLFENWLYVLATNYLFDIGFQEVGILEYKEGRVLSRRNAELVKEVVKRLRETANELLELLKRAKALEDDLEEVEDKPSDGKTKDDETEQELETLKQELVKILKIMGGDSDGN